MHQFIAAFFAMIFSFSHAQTVRHSETVLAAERPSAVAPAASVPSREELAHQVFATTTGYAETSCVSCRRMNLASNAH